MESQQTVLKHRRSSVFILEQQEKDQLKDQIQILNQNQIHQPKNRVQSFREAKVFQEPTSVYLCELEAEGDNIIQQENNNNQVSPQNNEQIKQDNQKPKQHQNQNLEVINHEQTETFERSSTRKGQEIKNMIHPQSKLLKQILKANSFNIDQLQGEAFLHLANVTIQSQSCNQKGKLLITNYRFAFFIQSRLKVDVALGFIQRVSTKEDKSSVLLQIYLKHSPVWKFRYEQKKQGQNADNLLQLYAFPSKLNYFFAFSHYKSILKKPESVIHYNFQKEFTRIGMLQNHKFKKLDNFDGSICSTYPNQLLVPCQATEQLIRYVAKARQRERFPVATYSVKGKNNATYILWRSSQLKSSQIKSYNDIQYMNMLSWLPIRIVQARTKHSAKQNIQSPDVYKQAIVQYLNLDPITTVKNSYYRVIQTYMASEQKKFIKEINESKWYDQIKNLLIGATIISNFLMNQKNVLVHCGDGWDRTSQLCALSLLLIDPYYRTIDGFAVLIQKQFVSFGDPFYLRLGLRGRNQQQIPLFIQFLDCVSQVMNQYPLSFQFSIKYITLLSNYIYTNRFGNFLCSSKNQLYQYKVRQNTLSIWQQLKKDRLAYNPYYLSRHETDISLLILNLESKSIRYWKQHFFYLTTNLKDNYKRHPSAEDNHDYLKFLHDKQKSDSDSLKKKVSEQFKYIMTLKSQLESINKSSNLLQEIQ